MNEITIIDNYEDLSLGKFTQITEIINEKNDEILSKELNILSVLSGKDINELQNMPITVVQQAFNSLRFLLTPPIPRKDIFSFSLNGKEYIAESQIKNWTSGRYIDFMHTLSDTENLTENTAKLIAICITPVGEKYGDTPLEEIEEIVWNYMPVELGIGITTFFLRIYQALIKTIEYYSESPKRTKKLTNKWIRKHILFSKDLDG